jgi:hypothetical protein
MRDKPILFNTEMVRAILDGRKTQTRRVVKVKNWLNDPPDSIHPDGSGKGWVAWWGKTSAEFSREAYPGPEQRGFSPPYRPGDRLWVRETWQIADWNEDGLPFVRYKVDGETQGPIIPPWDWVDRLWDLWGDLSTDENRAIDGKSAERVWRPSIHMPRWASRITLEVTAVRVERLQDISEEDAMAEGCTMDMPANGCHLTGNCLKDRFAFLWDSLAKPGQLWANNPWVWVIEFRRVPDA